MSQVHNFFSQGTGNQTGESHGKSSSFGQSVLYGTVPVWTGIRAGQTSSMTRLRDLQTWSWEDFFFLICCGRDGVRLHFSTRRHFIEIRGAQGISDINERALLVPNFEIVTLKSEQHSLQSNRCVRHRDSFWKSPPGAFGLFPRGQHHA